MSGAGGAQGSGRVGFGPFAPSVQVGARGSGRGEDLLDDLGLGVRVVLDAVPGPFGQFALVRLVARAAPASVARRSRNVRIRSASTQPWEKTCRLRLTSGPFRTRCSYQWGSRVTRP
ncbi:hypothetical protein BJF83_10025 [Nocardiopsis sp. CNR-923]|nr:hypothetical protein BJF83_10025 [Nocardiopsis sp. CNR-923]